MSDGYLTVSGAARNEHWRGWTDKDVAELLSAGSSSPLLPGMVPVTATSVRHQVVTDRPPTLVAEEAFAEWFDDLFPERAEVRKLDREEWRKAGIPVVKTVVALSRFIPRSAHPRAEEMTVGWLHSQFRVALADLNDLLSGVGFVSGRWEIGPLSLRDLPPLIPVLIASTDPLPDGALPAIAVTAQIHDGLPAMAGAFSGENRWTEEAIQLNELARTGEQPYKPFFRVVHGAHSEWRAGDGTRAVLELNTAIEMMIAITISGVRDLLGGDAEQIKPKKGVRNKVKEELAALLGREIDIDDPDTAWGHWFSDGYMSRNEAIHEGVSLESDVVDRAFAQAAAVVTDVRESLEAKEPLGILAERLELDTSEEDSLAEQPLGISFPWD